MRFDSGKGFVETENLLYHYTLAKTALDEILPKATLKLGRLQNSNDPMEFAGFGLRIPRSTEEPILDAIRRGLVTGWEAHDQLVTGARVVCFTEDRPSAATARNRCYGELSAGRGWSRDALWGNYADKHRGICVLFDRAGLLSCMRAQIHGDATFWSGPIVYSNALRLSGGRTLDPKDWVGATPEDRARAFMARRGQLQETFGRKRRDWRDEREYRLVVVQPSEPRELFDVRSAIHGLIVGDHSRTLKSLAFAFWPTSSGFRPLRSITAAGR